MSLVVKTFAEDGQDFLGHLALIRLHCEFVGELCLGQVNQFLLSSRLLSERTSNTTHVVSDPMKAESIMPSSGDFRVWGSHYLMTRGSIWDVPHDDSDAFLALVGLGFLCDAFLVLAHDA